MSAADEKKSRFVARIPAGVRERETIIRLNREQTRRVFELLDKPPKPNAALRSAKAVHRKLVRA